jgi:hypothetical protein
MTIQVGPMGPGFLILFRNVLSVISTGPPPIELPRQKPKPVDKRKHETELFALALLTSRQPSEEK